MPIGRIRKLVHLSQQTHLPNARLVRDHNDKGYGLIEHADGRDVYFAHDMVEGRRGFDNLRCGHTVEYTLENAPYLRAVFVRLVTIVSENTHRPAA